MKNHKALKYCSAAQKYTYSSEAKALKFVEAREDLKRAYYCPHCDGYHTTSQDLRNAIKYSGVVVDETEPTIDAIRLRLKELKL